MGDGRSPVADADLETHRLAAMLAVTLASRLLVDEKVAETVIGGFFGSS
jgi:hypothetical protein